MIKFAFWTVGFASIHFDVGARNCSLHAFPFPKYWMWGRNHYWKNQTVLDFGLGPLFRGFFTRREGYN